MGRAVFFAALSTAFFISDLSHGQNFFGSFIGEPRDGRPSYNSISGEISDPSILVLPHNTNVAFQKMLENDGEVRELRAKLNELRKKRKDFRRQNNLEAARDIENQISALDNEYKSLRLEGRDLRNDLEGAENTWYTVPANDDFSYALSSCDNSQKAVYQFTGVGASVGCTNQRGQLVKVVDFFGSEAFSTSEWVRDRSGRITKLTTDSAEKIMRVKVTKGSNTKASETEVEMVSNGDLTSKCEVYHVPRIDKESRRADAKKKIKTTR